jgi:predicted nuclease of predicted toxin-antitoxin system
MGGASDEAILQLAMDKQASLATLDADFHQLLAVTGRSSPSVIRVRIQGLDAAGMSALLQDVISRIRNEMEKGVAVSVLEDRIRIRQLPLDA